MPNDKTREEMNEEKTLMKNPNEYRIGDRLYVEKIKSCSCTEKRGNVYLLWCKIHQRGNNCYLYAPGTECLRKTPLGEKHLYLSEAAQQTVNEIVRQFDEETSDEMLKYHVKADMDKAVLWYRRLSHKSFSAVFEYRDDEGVLHKKIFPETGLESLIRELSYSPSPSWRDLFPEGDCPIEELHRGTPKGVEKNPIYLTAGAAGDVLLQKQLRLVYRVDSPEDCKWLSEALGQPVLPSLPDKHDREYYVQTGTIDFDLLRRSGYQILHRPAFGMKGSTRSVCTLDPHRKYGVDAAPKDAEAISFEEYLKLFNSAKT